MLGVVLGVLDDAAVEGEGVFAGHVGEFRYAAALGELMTGAQRMFDEQVAPHSPEQLAGPLLHRLLTWPGLARHVYGGKGVGSQGDGTAQFVARDAGHRDEAIRKIEAEFPGMRCYRLSVGPC